MEELSKYEFISEIDQLKYIKLSDEFFENGYLKEKVVQYIKANQIASISISYTNNFTLTGTQFLEQLPWIQNVLIVKHPLNLEGLSFLPHLKRIYIAENNIEKIDFSCFSKLKTAELTWNKERKSILDSFELQNLKLYGYKGKDLQNFKKLKNLSFLSLISTNVDNLKGVEYLPKLEKLEIHYNSKITELSNLNECTRLKKLTISHCSNLKDIHTLTNCPNLEFLSISNCKNIQGNNVIFDLKNLKVLGYSNSGAISSIEKITNLRNLERFLIYNTQIKDGNLQPLLQLKNLVVCDFQNKKNYSLTLEDIQRTLNINSINTMKKC